MSTSNTPQYCLLKTIRRWPYTKTSKVNQGVLKRFFDKEPFFNRIWDLYVVESSSIGNDVGGIVVPLEQVKAFFRQTEMETAVTLLRSDKELVLDLGPSTDYVVRLVGISASWDDYEKLLTLSSSPSSFPTHEHSNISINPPSKVHRQNRGIKSDKKRQMQMENRRNMLKSAVEIFVRGGDYTFFSVDIESWEKNHDIVTEVGLTKYIPGTRVDQGRLTGEKISDHIIIKENRRYKNGNYVADASGNFEFGNSRQVPLAEIKEAIVAFMGAPENHQRILIGHDINADIEYLRKLGYDDELKDFSMTFDTVEIWKAFANTFDGIGLSRLCSELDISAWNLHNAGNDARTQKYVLFLAIIEKTHSLHIIITIAVHHSPSTIHPPPHRRHHHQLLSSASQTSSPTLPPSNDHTFYPVLHLPFSPLAPLPSTLFRPPIPNPDPVRPCSQPHSKVYPQKPLFLYTAGAQPTFCDNPSPRTPWNSSLGCPTSSNPSSQRPTLKLIKETRFITTVAAMSAEEKTTTTEVSSVSNKLQNLSVNDGQDREGEAGEAGRTDEDYAQSPLTLRAIVSSKEAGVIIGKAGKNVADLRDETGVKAGVSKVVPGVHDRVLTVTGNLDGVAKAYAMVAQTLVDSPPGAIPTTPMGTHLRLLISHNQMGTIIGRQGLKIKHIQDVSGVRMVAQKEMLPQSTERIVEVQGSADGIRQAVWEIGKCLVDDWQRGTGTILYNPAVRSNTTHGTGSGPSVISNGGAGASASTDRFTNDRSNRGPVRTGNGTDFSEPSPSFPRRGHSDSTSRPSAPAPNTENGEELQTQNISIPADMVGCIIGRGGTKISEIRKSSGARISIAKAPHDDTGERMFTIVGSPQSNEKALYLLYENLEAEKTRRSQGSGQD
ncbi:uncharacterized protein DFL_007380 [Arthrobotrys flagrans]|uniref:K Homology domain-containing protein n=1 Tax=Arthrobotrys flagrans TaxID=97331 RepID=A0A436ZW39_ARTFL|nr:hypothetical protein DFL_007380 [Arthrobotrys flagrans]